MLTMPPPEAHEDEETEDTATDVMLAVSPTGLKERFRGVGRNLKRRYDDIPRDNRGFNLLELVIAVAIIAALVRIGVGVYSGLTDTARSTVLNSNIATAAEQVQFVLNDDPNIFMGGNAEFVAAISNRTDFEWEGGDFPFVAGDVPGLIRFQVIAQAGTPSATNVPPEVRWLVGDSSAVRLHMSNERGEWRCALIISQPSVNNIRTAARDPGTAVTAFGQAALAGVDGDPSTPYASTASDADLDAAAKIAAAQVRGSWFDGGATIQNNGSHNCLPLYTHPSGTARAVATAPIDAVLPDNNRLWTIASANVDPTSVATGTAANSVTLHGSVGGLDRPE